MTPPEILVCRQDDAWCVHAESALFERMERKGDAMRVARAHARACARSGTPVAIRVAGERRTFRD